MLKRLTTANLSRGYSSWWGCALQTRSLNFISDKRKKTFQTRFHTWSLKSRPVLRPKTTQIIMSTKRSISNSRIIFLPYSFGIEKSSTFIHSRSFLENLSHSDQNVTSLYPFSDQNVIERRYLVFAHCISEGSSFKAFK